METVDTIIFREISEIRGITNRPYEARICNIDKDFLDDRGVSDDSFWERMKKLQDQGKSFFLSKALYEPTGNNSNTIHTIPTASLPTNTPVCPNYDKDIFLLSEGIDSLEQIFDIQLQNLA